MTPEELSFLIGGVALLVIGAAVAALRPRSVTALALAGVALGLGLHGVLGYVQLSGGTLLAPLLWLGSALTGAGTWMLFWRFPERITPSRRAEARAVGAISLALGATWMLVDAINGDLVDAAFGGPFSAAIYVVFALFETSGTAALILGLPLRAARLAPEQVGASRSLAFVALGLTLFSAGISPAILATARGEIPLNAAGLYAFYLIVPTLLWIRATHGAHPAAARNVVLAGVVIYLGSLLVSPNLGWGVGRVLGALVLAYAVLRGEIEGLDLKVRFAISRSTIAAAFVAAFFLASEGAQLVLGQGNEWVGLLGAGALVFAMAPLQRAAERLAERAVPSEHGGQAAPAPASARREATYSRAARYTLRDGRMDHEEELHLARLATDLGISAERAVELRHEVERDLREARDADGRSSSWR